MKSVKEIVADLLPRTVVNASCWLKVKEQPHCHRPAWNVFARAAGAKRGRHVFTVIVP